MSSLYKQVEKYVIDSYTTDGILSLRGKHLLKTKDWLIRIYPNADEAMQIAAVAHDIDSAFTDYKFRGSFSDPAYLDRHQNESARILRVFLESIRADDALIRKVVHLISKHEVGGDDEQNIIKDADSLSFFDRDMSVFIKIHLERGSTRESVNQKIAWMYERITTPMAKRLAEPFYIRANELLK